MKKITVSAVKDFLLPAEDEQISEGEEIIRDFLEDEGIAFEREVKITGLAGDTKAYRCADFHLKRLNIYVEFFGQWNQSPEHRDRYREKKNVYYINQIPCVYLYPENLGTLDHSFHRRVSAVLQAHVMKKELQRFDLWTFWKDHKWHVIGAVVLGVLTLTGETLLDRVVFGGIFLFVIVQLRRHWHRHTRPVPVRKPKQYPTNG